MKLLATLTCSKFKPRSVEMLSGSSRDLIGRGAFSPVQAVLVQHLLHIASDRRGVATTSEKLHLLEHAVAPLGPQNEA